MPPRRAAPETGPRPSTMSWMVALLCLTPALAEGQRTAVATQLARLAAVEDARGSQGRDLTSLATQLNNPNAAVRLAAARGLGRQQDPRWLPQLYPVLKDADVAVRLEAVNALGQATQRYRDEPSGVTSRDVMAALDSLEGYGRRSRSGIEAGMVARTIGRLPYKDSSTARRATAAIVELDNRAGGLLVAREGVLHGLYTLALRRPTLGAPAVPALDLMRAALRTNVPGATASRVRRLAMIGLGAARALDTAIVRSALSDPDDQVRRLGVNGAAVVGDSTLRRRAVLMGLRDTAFLVRLEAVRGARAFAASDGCDMLTDAAHDRNAHVALAAIDGLTATCRDRDRVAEFLLGLIDANRSDDQARARGRSGWHVHAHALLALARVAPDRARALVRRDARESTLWTVRTYVARAAAQLDDTVTLRLLADDKDGNVRQLAISGLAALVGHEADPVFVQALGSREYHVVMEAAQALKGSDDRTTTASALMDALERLTTERRENSRDPREAILVRLEELGSPQLVPRLMPFRTDFDSAVARRAAVILTKWTNSTVLAAPSPLSLPVEDVTSLLRGRWVARVTMSPISGGGSFDIELFPREAPYTVARFARLARAGYYNGLTFHRVEPGFVIQGGSPSATEYVGDGPFMRDELDTRSHTRGTLGISTRGRDTGDAQLFVNLIDNFRLDHDYTVFGEIVRGRDVAEGVLEADVIARITIMPRAPSAPTRGEATPR